MDRLNPRSPLVLDTKSLGRRPGSMVEVQRTVEAPADFGTDVIAVQEGQPIKLELRLESVVEGVLVTGSVHATATGACVRCLDPVSHEVDGPSRSCSPTPIARPTTVRWGPTTTKPRSTISWTT